jgi:hypothetical protein
MARDSIVEETRRVREELAKAQDYDLGRIVRVLKREEASGGRKLVNLPSRRLTTRAAKRKVG